LKQMYFNYIVDATNKKSTKEIYFILGVNSVFQ
jgi:hypothetical protein